MLGGMFLQLTLLAVIGRLGCANPLPAREMPPLMADVSRKPVVEPVAEGRGLTGSKPEGVNRMSEPDLALSTTLSPMGVPGGPSQGMEPTNRTGELVTDSWFTQSQTNGASVQRSRPGMRSIAVGQAEQGQTTESTLASIKASEVSGRVSPATQREDGHNSQGGQTGAGPRRSPDKGVDQKSLSHGEKIKEGALGSLAGSTEKPAVLSSDLGVDDSLQVTAATESASVTPPALQASSRIGLMVTVTAPELSNSSLTHGPPPLPTEPPGPEQSTPKVTESDTWPSSTAHRAAGPEQSPHEVTQTAGSPKMGSVMAVPQGQTWRGVEAITLHQGLIGQHSQAEAPGTEESKTGAGRGKVPGGVGPQDSTTTAGATAGESAAIRGPPMGFEGPGVRHVAALGGIQLSATPGSNAGDSDGEPHLEAAPSPVHSISGEALIQPPSQADRMQNISEPPSQPEILLNQHKALAVSGTLDLSHATASSTPVIWLGTKARAGPTASEGLHPGPGQEETASEGLHPGPGQEETASVGGIPLIFEPLDDTSSLEGAVTDHASTRSVSSVATISPWVPEPLERVTADPEHYPTRVPPNGQPEGPSVPWQMYSTEITDTVSPSVLPRLTAPPAGPPLDYGSLDSQEPGVLTGVTEALAFSTLTPPPKSTRQPLRTTVGKASSLSLPRPKSGLEELESEEEHDHEDDDEEETEESEEEESKEEAAETPTPTPMPRTYSHVPYHIYSSSVWVQRHQGLVRSWVEKIRDKAGYVSGMLAPVGIGIAGALFILGALYSIKVMHRKRRSSFKQQRRKHRETNSRQDRVMLLADSSEDEF